MHLIITFFFEIFDICWLNLNSFLALHVSDAIKHPILLIPAEKYKNTIISNIIFVLIESKRISSGDLCTSWYSYTYTKPFLWKVARKISTNSARIKCWYQQSLIKGTLSSLLCHTFFEINCAIEIAIMVFFKSF